MPLDHGLAALVTRLGLMLPSPPRRLYMQSLDAGYTYAGHGLRACGAWSDDIHDGFRPGQRPAKVEMIEA